MEPMSVIYLISTILTTLMAADQTLGPGLAAGRSTKISKAITDLATAMAKDRELANRLLDAYNRRDNILLTQLLNASPFSTRFHMLKDAYKKNQSNIAKTTQTISDIDSKSQELTNLAQHKQQKSQTTGSVIMDLVKGRAVDPNLSDLPKHVPSGITNKTISEVNYGQK